MPTYLMLSTLTPQGVQTLKANPSRLREVNQDVEELGAKVLHQWATLGEYDFVNILEAPDAATVAKVSLALGARGSAKLQSLELIDLDTLLGVSTPSGNPARATRAGAGSVAGPASGRRRCTPSAPRRWAHPGGRATRGAGSGRVRPELELAATVDRDPMLGAVVVEVEEPLDGAEARRLRVQAVRWKRQRLDVVDGMDREVPGEPPLVRLEHGARLVVQAGVLEPRLRESLGDAAVELCRRRRVEPVALVQALEIDDVDGAGGSELGDDLVRPRVARVELEAKSGVEVEQLPDRALRDDERDRPRLPLERSGERASGLPQREVEGRRLESPGPVARLVGDERRERVERVLAGQVGQSVQGERELQLAVVADVLADALVPCAVQVDDGRSSREVLQRKLVRLELDALDRKAQILDSVIERHRQPPPPLRAPRWRRSARGSATSVRPPDSR